MKPRFTTNFADLAKMRFVNVQPPGSVAQVELEGLKWYYATDTESDVSVSVGPFTVSDYPPIPDAVISMEHNSEGCSYCDRLKEGEYLEAHCYVCGYHLGYFCEREIRLCNDCIKRLTEGYL